MTFLVRAAVAAASRKTVRPDTGPIQPTVLDITFSATNAIVTSHTVNYPANVRSGDLLICAFALNPTVSSPDITTPSGWNFIIQSGTSPVIWYAYRIADGSEDGDSFNIVTEFAGHAMAAVIRIADGTFDPGEVPEVVGGIDPPSWGVGETMWIAAAAADRDPAVTAYPFTDNQSYQKTTGSTASDRVGLGICTRIAEDQSDDTGSYSFSPNFGSSTQRIAIAPVEHVIPSLSFTDVYPDTASVSDFFFTDTPVVSNGTPPYAYSIESGSLPPGVDLSAGSGQLSGTPTTEGSYSFIIRLTDAASNIYDLPVEMEVVLLDLTVEGAYGETATVGESYYSIVTPSHGRAPYTFTVQSGSLPSWLNLSAEGGDLYGMPLAEGSEAGFTIRCTDDDGEFVDVVVASIEVDKQPLARDDVGEFPSVGTVGVEYYGSDFYHAGQPPYVFSIISGSTPPGCPLDTDTGEVYGTPTTPGTYNFTIRCTDDDANHVDAAHTIVIST